VGAAAGRRGGGAGLAGLGLTVGEICDLAYLLFTEQREARATAHLSALLIRGAEIDLPAALEEERERFDALLEAEVEPTPEPAGGLDDEERELREALGVARGPRR